MLICKINLGVRCRDMIRGLTMIKKVQKYKCLKRYKYEPLYPISIPFSCVTKLAN